MGIKTPQNIDFKKMSEELEIPIQFLGKMMRMAILLDKKKALRMRRSNILFEDAESILNSVKPFSEEECFVIYGIGKFFRKNPND